jgi:hypothetical protein
MHDVGIMMALLKISRISFDHENAKDSFVDAIGYVALAGELAVEKTEDE